MSDGTFERTGEPEIATTTLAEIYVQQGLIDRALAIYRRLALRSPGDDRVAARVLELEQEIEQRRAAAAGPPESPAPAAPPEAAAAPAEVPAAIPPETAADAPEPPTPDTAEPQRSASPAAEDAEFLAWLERR